MATQAQVPCRILGKLQGHSVEFLDASDRYKLHLQQLAVSYAALCRRIVKGLLQIYVSTFHYRNSSHDQHAGHAPSQAALQSFHKQDL